MAALAQALPEARVHDWAAGGAPACDYAVCWKPPAAFFAGQRRLKAILNIGAGADAVLADTNLPLDVPVVRLDDAGMGAQMEEYVAWCAFHFLRRMDDYARAQRDALWDRLPPRARGAFPIGIMGLGVLGARVAAFMRDLGFPVRGWSASPKAIAGVECFAGPQALAAFLAPVRLLVCLLPLTDATRGILNRETLGMLPRGAALVNIARGGHLVEADLIALLDDAHLAGAVLDVFPVEPLPAASALWRHPRVVVTPHVSAMTLVEESMQQIAAKIRALEQGRPVVGVIDRARGY
ncbi:MAG: glyoxylate/hydroxypyruvate reductase A [Burkholderiales bacterium]|nr:glyoxylate/hydroxypyruvate reductase A [Burkholderiales bacterium]